jgi:hypothetical protein
LEFAMKVESEMGEISMVKQFVQNPIWLLVFYIIRDELKVYVPYPDGAQKHAIYGNGTPRYD